MLIRTSSAMTKAWLNKGKMKNVPKIC